MKKFRRKPKPGKQCDLVRETWGPHPGCAEFMDKPEVHPCNGPATHVLKFTEPGYEPGDAKTMTYKWKLCEFDAQNMPTGRIYRFRRI